MFTFEDVNREKFKDWTGDDIDEMLQDFTIGELKKILTAVDEYFTKFCGSEGKSISLAGGDCHLKRVMGENIFINVDGIEEILSDNDAMTCLLIAYVDTGWQEDQGTDFAPFE
jgi:hypothetical protein